MLLLVNYVVHSVQPLNVLQHPLIPLQNISLLEFVYISALVKEQAAE